MGSNLSGIFDSKFERTLAASEWDQQPGDNNLNKNTNVLIN